MISVLVITYNEAATLAECLASIPWRDDIHILDSGSEDATRDIARSFGATVTTRAFDNFASQRNAGLALPFKSEWILMLDADERLTPGLAQEIENTVKNAPPEIAMYRVRRRDMLMGRWLRRSSGYPTWFARLLRRGRVRVEREINELYEADGLAGKLQGHIVHFPFAKGVEWWFDRHNRYSTAEARILAAKRDGPRVPFSGLISRDPSIRRQALKRVASRTPGRPAATFVFLYLIRGGFLDGRPGLVFASMRMAYEIMIDAKVAFLSSTQRR